MQLFVDMDGVLADFDTHHENVFGVRASKLDDNVDWKAVRAVDNFYLDIPPMQDFPLLWRFVSRYSPIVLTGVPHDVPEAAANKMAWVHHHIGKRQKIICCPSKDKSMFGTRNDILVDDWEKHRERWEMMGGIWVTHVSAIHTIDQLVGLGL